MNATNWTRLACLCGMLWSCMAVAQEVTREADTLEVLVLLPFCVDADTMDNGAFPPKVVRLREIALEHLHGFELAAQQLAEAGMDIRLTVKDEMPDSAGRQRVTNLDIARTDMVFGPLMREQVGRVAPRVDRFGREHILLTEQPSRLVDRGPGLRQAVPSEVSMARRLAEEVVARHDTDRVVLVVTQGPDLALEEAFMETFDALQRDKWMTPLDSMRYALLDTVHGTTKSIGALPQWISPYDRNIVVSVAGRSARSMWAALWTEVQMNDTSECFIFGHPEVADMPFLEGPLMEQWRLTLAQSGEVRWEDEAVAPWVQAFWAQSGTDPSKYATLAHDALLDAAIRRFPALRWAVQPLAEPMVWTQLDSAGAWHNDTWAFRFFRDWQWMPLDSAAALEPFVAHPFYDPEGLLIPIPPDALIRHPELVGVEPFIEVEKEDE